MTPTFITGIRAFGRATYPLLDEAARLRLRAIVIRNQAPALYARRSTFASPSAARRMKGGAR
jgi:hypothetical protein